MKKNVLAAVLTVLGLSLTFIHLSAANEAAQVADFNDGQYMNAFGKTVEVWLKGDGSDETQGVAMELVQDDALGEQEGYSLKMTYDVESENPAYNGVRTDLAGFDASGFSALSFYIKGDSPQLKIELIGPGGRPSPYIVQGITREWQKISIPTSEFFVVRDWTQLQKFVVVFADITNNPQTGTMFLDEITFE